MTKPNEPIEYISRTRDLYSAHTPYRWVHSDEPAAFVEIGDDLADMTILLISSSGMFIGGAQEPFGLADDASIREIPADVDRSLLWPSHFGYKTERAESDPNTVFPLDRLRELADDGVIGGVSSHAITFMGGVYSHRRSRDELVPAVIESARRTEVDLALLVPV